MKHLITEYFAYRKEKQFHISFRKILALIKEILTEIYFPETRKKMICELDKVLDKLINRNTTQP